MEKKWHSTKLEESPLAWQDSLKVYRREDNKDRPRTIFRTVARLTESHHYIEPCIPGALLCNGFMNFFNNQFIFIGENSLQFTDSSSPTGMIEAIISPNVCLESFHPIDLHEITTT